MMTNNDQNVGDVYWTPGYDGQDDFFGEPLGREVLEQYEDTEEMSQWYELDAYQDFTDETAIYPEDKGLEYTALGLASEAGEFAGKIKKWIRDGKKDDEALVAELGDVLWYVAQAAAAMDVHLSDVAKTNVEKLKSRKERNVLGGSGDDR